jgi:hypothetical protein
LRYAIDVANPGSTITFDANLRGTIMLTSGDLNIAKNLTIRGPGAGILSISGGKSGLSVRVEPGVTVTLSGLAFKDSKTSKGFIDNEGTLTLSKCIIAGNSTTGKGIGEVGAGIYNDLYGTLTLSNSIVSGNTTTGNGSSIENDGTLTLTNSTVSGNKATGGGIFNFIGNLTLNNSTVSGNTATGQYAGGIFNEGTLTLNSSTVSGNTATGHNSEGGGIFIGGSASDTFTLSNSTISGNRANSGGGIAINDKFTGSGTTFTFQGMLLYCTVYGNTANSGAGIRVDVDPSDKQSQVSMGASNVAGNNALTGPDIMGHLTSLGYNLVGDRSGTTFLGSPKVQSTDVLGVPLTDLKIDPVLRDNGGSVRPHTWTHALLPRSPAIDLIPTDICMMFKIFNDQRGVRRPQGKGCDSGAYEYVPSQ